MGRSERWKRWENTGDNAEERTDTKQNLESTRERSPISPLLSTSHNVKDVKLTSFD